MKKTKALVLFSGGLDSILAIKLLLQQGISVQGLALKSAFFGVEEAKKVAKEIGIPLRIIDFSTRHLQVVKNPKFGYGKNMNPCIDCHLLMLKTAKKIMAQEGFDFIATGEVLGERPMSQNKQTLKLLEKEAGLIGKILRPLSAKLLLPTEAEKKGLVDRNQLLDIHGRSRKRQLALAKKWRIDWYPTPAGGCLLTDPEFSKKLRELLDNNFEADKKDVKLLKIGRHFWLDSLSKGKSKTKIVIGRNHKENARLKKIRQKGDILIELEAIPGPVALVRSYQNKIPAKAIQQAKDLVQRYALKAREKKKIKFKVF